MGETITLKADTFKYPTKEERRKINNIIPKIERFNVEYKSATIGILQNSSFETAIREEDIYWWCNCVNNRLGKMEETFVYVNTHYLRELEIKNDEAVNQYTDKLLLEYFIEIFYYYYFSTRDVIGQLLNVYCDLKLREDKIFLNEKFLEQIHTEEIKNALTDFLNNTKDSYNIRNSFNHRFTPINKDFRATKNVIKDGNTIKFYSAKDVKIEVFIADIESLMKHFAHLTQKLVLEIK
ncbi:Cthe_2314 family HEPN domain-containing protein [Myroides sp. NP-2]|uniref:Cthe_2314 family HEPN domain-containing protein n=1 Tax=unclassified Myroides TaxID=2642485 RepID=UPI0015F7EC24|nr:Cthe_2314 family HEPN domain-containing protein [Myroides sp. NP-2]MBB1151301.1 hypothetical protein [Myroides sp. NP-2]